MSRSHSGWEDIPVKQHHVVHNPNGGWDVKAANAQRASAHSTTKAEAISIARTISQNQGSELFIHNMNGQISSRDCNGKPPAKPVRLEKFRPLRQ